MLSTSARQLATIIFSETPTVPQLDWPADDTIKTLVLAAVPV